MSGIVEIAERAGVSPATVSRALRGMHHVNERTRTKIVAAAMELNYPLRPDLIPLNLVKKTNRIGVIAPYISRWFFSQAINGIEQSLREVGMDLLLTQPGFVLDELIEGNEIENSGNIQKQNIFDVDSDS